MQAKRFRKITGSDLELIMNWRMQPDITRFMYTDPKLTIEDQKRWYENITKDENARYWIYEMEGKPIGLVNFVDWDRKNSIVHTGGYIAEKEGRTLQNIIDMNMNLYHYIFSILEVNKAAFEIMDNNMSQVQWMKRIGATIEGVSRQAVKKNDIYHDLYLMSILKEEWGQILQKNHYNAFEIE